MKRLFLVGSLSFLFTVALTVACSSQPTGSQYTYSYVGCAAGGDSCPNDRTLTCAELDILNQNDDCTQDSDCVISNVQDKCIGILSCDGPPPVNKDKKAAFETAFNAEFDKYCASPNCNNTTVCAPGARRNVILCFEGKCTRAFHLLDAGEDDGGLPAEDAGLDAGSDAGVDAGFDAGEQDASLDAGLVDAGDLDAGDLDAGLADAGDAG